MKKASIKIFCAVMALVMSCATLFAGCFGNASTPTDFTIQYTDDTGVHQIAVKTDMPYSMESVPERKGYDFLGLFDAEEGGTQYVSANGSSIAPFTAGKNLVLFPQFKAKEFTLFLDYQGGTVTGAREYTVSYGARLPELPKNVALDHSEFTGWFTAENCGGVQVADKYGLLADVSYVNDGNFDLSGNFIYLYAGFEAQKHTVTFCFGSGVDDEQMKVVYNTPISEVVPKTRVDGKAVLAWSKSQGGEPWNGRITEDLTLYALEYAPVIELDPNGGNEINPVVALAGSKITLPTPTHPVGKFLYWQDSSGNKYTSTNMTMPNASITLKAVWQAKIVFDENGGADVDDISLEAGSVFTLPTPQKEGYLFAGWYTADKERYTSSIMPSSGIALKAGWYKEITEDKVIISATDSKIAYYQTSPSTSKLCYTLTHGDYFERGQTVTLTLDLHVKLKTSSSTEKTVCCDLYSQKQISSSCFMQTLTFTNVTNAYKEYTASVTVTVSDNFYLCWYVNSSKSCDLYLQDYYRTLHYPDTTKLYL